MLRHRTMVRKMREEAEAARKAAAAAEEAERAKKAKNDAPSGAGGITTKRKRGGSSGKKRSAGGESQQNGKTAKKEKISKRCKCHLARCYECGGTCVKCDCTCPSKLNARGKLKSRGMRKRETSKPGGVGSPSSPNKKNGKIGRTASANVELLPKKTCKCHTARCYECGGACIRCDCACSSRSKSKPKAKVTGKLTR